MVSPTPGPAQLEQQTLKSHTVLLVDDEPANLTVLRLSLADTFAIHCVESAAEALDYLAQHPVSVLLADHLMPGMTGIDLCEAVLTVHPNIERLILTAYGDSEILLDAINRGRVSRFLLKPWEPIELSFALREAIWRIEARQELQRLRQRWHSGGNAEAMNLGTSATLHDLANALQPILFEANALGYELKRASPQTDTIQQTHQRIMLGLEHLAALHLSLKPKRPRISKPTHLSTVVERSLELLRNDALASQLVLSSTCSDTVHVAVDPTHLTRVIFNLVLNATQAIMEARRKGHVRVEVTQTSERATYLRVVDNGPGVPASMRDALFKPGFTSREERGGTGLGLAICKQITESWGGCIRVEYSSDKGTCILVELPPTDAKQLKDSV